MIMANSEEKGMVPPADLQQTPTAGDEAEKEKLLKHEEAAKALGSKVDPEKLKEIEVYYAGGEGERRDVNRTSGVTQ
uniref:Cation_ATPase_N domain-containing protein n=1 Tax=Ascaris lumbricoides TaxID=6252 RepID=A0A0M3IM21_ASCLU